MPCGTLSAMQAELYGGDARFAARAIAYSTLLSLVGIQMQRKQEDIEHQRQNDQAERGSDVIILIPQLAQPDAARCV